MNTEEIENKIDEKIRNIIGNDVKEKRKEYRWDDANLIKYKDKLVERLKIDYPYWANNAYEEIANRDLPLINPILEKNLLEYINGEPLSDIEIGNNKYTVKSILSLRKNAGGFLEAIKDLSIYSVDEDLGSSKISSRYITF